ncbi:MAG: nucleoside-diphosphate sugar epimerase/dehydratase [Candidatus Limnocylindrales bacterium]
MPPRLVDALRRPSLIAGGSWSSLVDGAAIGRIARRMRGRHLLVIDLLGIVVAAYVALAIRYETLPGPTVVGPFLPVFGLLLAARAVVNVRLGLYARSWRFASIPEVERIVGAIVLGSVVSVVLFYAVVAFPQPYLPTGLPRSFWPTEMLLSIAILGGERFAIRAAYDWAPSSWAGPVTAQRLTLLYGAGRTGVLMARSAERNPAAGVAPVGFLDDDPSLAGKIVAGLRVFGGRGWLAQAVDLTGARMLLITMPSAHGAAVRPVVDAALRLGLEVRTVPPLTDLFSGSIDASRIRRVRVEDLLQRPIVTEHVAGVDEIVRDRVVMITGGAGSIGSELARQVFTLQPRRLILVDRAESPLYLIQRELEVRECRGQRSGELVCQLANITNRQAMDDLISEEKPSVLFHAAAYKHVPLMEAHPSDAMFVNVCGTLAVLDAAARAGVGRFVFVSTDKAVRPTSVMGASKRLAEMLVTDTARRTGRPYVSVRFGNVLGSNGSVVPIFQEQLERGEPLTITDPAMTRYFMTIPEAAWLILDAAALGKTGDLFVLDMGEPIRVIDLAKDLVRLAGRDPESQPIEIVGLRPGEKLHEELFYASECVQPTQNPKVLRTAADVPPQTVRDDALRMMGLATGHTEELLRRALLDYALGRNHQADARELSGPPAVDPGTPMPAPFTLASIGASAGAVAIR